MADIKQAGYLALCEAHRRFDPAKGSFDTFVYLSLRGAMLNEAVRADWQPSYYRRRNGGGPMMDARMNSSIHTAVLAEKTGVKQGGSRETGDCKVLTALIASPLRPEDIDIKRLLERLPLSEREKAIIRTRIEGRKMADVATEIGVNRFTASRIATAMIRRIKEEL